MAKIMIADDSDSIRIVLGDILSIGKHEVVCEAIDGADAVEKYSKIKPEIILLDLTMPKKNGLDVVKEIISSHPDAKIILVTASGEQQIIHDCIQAGALGYISKPFDFDNVLKTVSDISAK